MIDFFSKYKWFAVVLLVLSAVIISMIYSILKPRPVLPIFQPAEVNAEMVDSTLQHVKKYHEVSSFKLTNQNGVSISEKDYQDKIYIADFFFTTCQTICPIMTDHMEQLQEELKEQQDVLLLSHTVMPEVDSVAQLKKYALENGVDDTKWNLVTGDKKQIYDLARRSYLAAKENPENPYGLIHTENFVLVDRENRIRGFYDGTDPEVIAQVLQDIEILKNEGKKTYFFGLFERD
ncbi:MAG: SCO family protein [Flavobacteriaceae bacterium]|nr:SCO family protein [Flavobacteriaceae bacterium]